MPRYHFTVRTMSTKSHPAQVFTPAYRAATLELAEAMVRDRYPNAFRVLLDDVTEQYDGSGDYCIAESGGTCGCIHCRLEEPLVWESREAYAERTGRTLVAARWRELVATSAARAGGVAEVAS